MVDGITLYKKLVLNKTINFRVAEKDADDSVKAELDGIISGLSEYLDKVGVDEERQKSEIDQHQQEKANLVQELEGLRRKLKLKTTQMYVNFSCERHQSSTLGPNEIIDQI